MSRKRLIREVEENTPRVRRSRGEMYLATSATIMYGRGISDRKLILLRRRLPFTKEGTAFMMFASSATQILALVFVRLLGLVKYSLHTIVDTSGICGTYSEYIRV